MPLVTFDATRCLNLSGVRYIKPENLFLELDTIRQARGCLFPEFWQINPLYFALQKPIFPSLPSYLIGHNKIEMTRCFQIVVPLNTPDTLILPNSPNAADQAWQQMCLPFVAKIPKSARGEGVFLIQDRDDWNAYLRQSEVIYVQEYLPIDRDLRVVWVGDEVLASYWRVQPEGGFHNNLARGGRIERGIAPAAALELVDKLARDLGINYGGFDIAMVGDRPYVLEFNRHFGTSGLEGLEKSHDQAVFNWVTTHWPGPLEPDKPSRSGRVPLRRAG